MSKVRQYRDKNGELISIYIEKYRGMDSEGRELPRAYKKYDIPKGLSKRKQEEFIRQKQVEFDLECDSGLTMKRLPTFENYAGRVLELKKANGVKDSTLARYRELLTRINASIGYLRLDKIRPANLNDLYRELLSDGANKISGGPLSAKTVREYHNLISTILNTAYREMLIKENVAERADPPKVRKHEVQCYSPEEVKTILEVSKEWTITWRVMTEFFLLTGTRRGEALGLKWNDVDLDKGIISIKTNRLYTSSIGVYQDRPKTDSSIRNIDIPQVLVNELTALKKYQEDRAKELGDAWVNSGYVFVTDLGNPFNPDSVTTQYRRLSERDDRLPHLNPHAFRHTFASISIPVTQDVKTVSALMGHTNAAFTQSQYQHIIPGRGKAVMNKVANTIMGENI